jgi:hypothetical protein
MGTRAAPDPVVLHDRPTGRDGQSRLAVARGRSTTPAPTIDCRACCSDHRPPLAGTVSRGGAGCAARSVEAGRRRPAGP